MDRYTSYTISFMAIFFSLSLILSCNKEHKPELPYDGLLGTYELILGKYDTSCIARCEFNCSGYMGHEYSSIIMEGNQASSFHLSLINEVDYEMAYELYFDTIYQYSCDDNIYDLDEPIAIEPLSGVAAGTYYLEWGCTGLGSERFCSYHHIKFHNSGDSTRASIYGGYYQDTTRGFVSHLISDNIINHIEVIQFTIDAEFFHSNYVHEGWWNKSRIKLLFIR